MPHVSSLFSFGAAATFSECFWWRAGSAPVAELTINFVHFALPLFGLEGFVRCLAFVMRGGTPRLLVSLHPRVWTGGRPPPWVVVILLRCITPGLPRKVSCFQYLVFSFLPRCVAYVQHMVSFRAFGLVQHCFSNTAIICLGSGGIVDRGTTIPSCSSRRFFPDTLVTLVS